MIEMPSAPDAEFLLPDEAATRAFAAQLAAIARPHDVIALYGDLGAGKTAFSRAFINALPGPAEEVPSPTFTLVQWYRRKAVEIWHFDCYRIEDPEEVWEIGLEEALAGGISLIEWPQKLGRNLPRKRLDIIILHGETGQQRKVQLHCHAKTWLDRLEALTPDVHS